jgi:hypothetical protein
MFHTHCKCAFKCFIYFQKYVAFKFFSCSKSTFRWAAGGRRTVVPQSGRARGVLVLSCSSWLVLPTRRERRGSGATSWRKDKVKCTRKIERGAKGGWGQAAHVSLDVWTSATPIHFSQHDQPICRKIHNLCFCIIPYSRKNLIFIPNLSLPG